MLVRADAAAIGGGSAHAPPLAFASNPTAECGNVYC